MSLFSIRDNGLRLSDFNKSERKALDKPFKIFIKDSGKDLQAWKEIWLRELDLDRLKAWLGVKDIEPKKLIMLLYTPNYLNDTLATSNNLDLSCTKLNYTDF